MQLEELKLITASNIINLRTRAGMTQAELGYKLNYSDKTISKWERAEAIPDAFVLKQMGEIFGVTVNDLLSSHDEWKPIPTEEPETEEVSYSTGRIIAIAVVGVWTLALTAFVALWLVGLIVSSSTCHCGLRPVAFFGGLSARVSALPSMAAVPDRDSGGDHRVPELQPEEPAETP